MANQENQFETKMSKSGLPVPIIKGVHLHSAYDPEKEADSMVNKYINLLEEKSQILLLGLGFGYHLNVILKWLSKFHKENYQVIVIEPNQRTVDEFKKISKIDLKNVQIICCEDMDSIYQKKEVVQFLASKPGLITHPASFNLYGKFYKDFMTYRADKSIKELLKNISNEDISRYLMNYQDNLTLVDVIDSIKNGNGKITNKLDFAFLALNKLTEEAQKTEAQI